MSPRFASPRFASSRFAGLRHATAPTDLRAAILGASAASPYVANQRSHAADAPAAIRAASQTFAKQLNQFDFDIGATWSKDLLAAAADLGDIPTDPADPAGNRARITQAIHQVLAAGAVPILLGGDDSVPIPAFQGYDGHGPLVIVQIDAHADWGDVIRNNPLGYGSTMRRASEMPWIASMLQVGIRGLGSGTPDQLETARAWGARIVTAAELREGGAARVIDMVPAGARVVLSIDCDGLDPAVLPAVNMPTPGGLDMVQLTALLRGIAARASIVGCNVVELVPRRDPTGLSALVAARIVLTVLGLVLTSRPPAAPPSSAAAPPPTAP